MYFKDSTGKRCQNYQKEISFWYLPVLITLGRTAALPVSAGTTCHHWASHCLSQNLMDATGTDFPELENRRRARGPCARQHSTSWAAVGLLAHRGPVSTLSLQVCPPGQVLLLQAMSAGRGGHTTWFQRRWHRRKAAGCFCVLH